MRRPERELAEARMRYIGALGRLAKAQEALLMAGVPLHPGRDDRDVIEWSRGDVQVVSMVAAAWAEVVDARRAWDQMRRPSREPPPR